MRAYKRVIDRIHDSIQADLTDVEFEEVRCEISRRCFKDVFMKVRGNVLLHRDALLDLLQQFWRRDVRMISYNVAKIDS